MAWVPAVQVALGLGFVYGVLPRVLFGRPSYATGVADRLLIDVTRMTALMIAAVHVMVPLRIFQWTGLLIAITVWALVRLRRDGWNHARILAVWERFTRVVLYLVEAGSREGNNRVKSAVSTWLRTHVVARLRPRFERRTFIALVALLPLVAVLGATLVMRLNYPLTNAAFAASDSYVHLTWTKEIAFGNLFADGVYPRGMHSVLAVVATLTPAKSFDVVRFAGPMFNTFVVFVVFAIASRATRNYVAALVAATVAGVLALRPEIGMSGLRQVGTLPQEFAMLFGLVCVWMVALYVVRPHRGRLFVVALAGFCVAMTHPLGSGLVAIAAVAGGGAALLRSRRLGPPLRIGLAASVGTVIGFAYVPFALQPARRYAPVNQVNPIEVARNDPGVVQPVGVESLMATNGFLRLAIAGFAVGLIYALWLLVRKDTRGPITFTASAFGVLCVGLQVIGGDVLKGWYHVRWTELILPVLPLGFAFVLAPLRGLWSFASKPGRIVAASTAAATAVAVLVVAMPPVLPAPKDSQIEYEDAARAIGTIIRSNERRTFTVVGPPAAYNHVLGAGYHVHLTDVVDRIRPEDAYDPGFTFPIPTAHLYVFTEKEAFAFGARAKIKGEIRRYYDLESRQLLMDTVEGWMRVYARYHKGAEVVHETENLRVWKVTQEPPIEYAKRYAIYQRGTAG